MNTFLSAILRASAAAVLLATAMSAYGADKKPKPAPKPAASAEKAAPAKPAPAKPVATGPLVWRGDVTTARAFMNDLAKQYEREKKKKVEINPFSTLSGLDAVTAGSADFAGSARPAHVKRSEESNLVFVPVAWDALVLVAYPSNPVKDLRLKDVWRLYYGKTTNWKELGGKDLPVNMYAVAGPLDGVEYSLRWLIFKNGDQRVAAPRLYLNTTKLEEAVTLDPAGLGVTTLSGASGNPKIKMLSIEGVVPSIATVGNGSYPLYTPLYLALREDGAKTSQVREFIAWLDTPGARATLKKHQLLPYDEGAALLAGDGDRLAMIQTKVNETPIAAPSATAAALTRVAPTSPATQAAKERETEARARRVEAKEAKKADAKSGSDKQ